MSEPNTLAASDSRIDRTRAALRRVALVCGIASVVMTLSLFAPLLPPDIDSLRAFNNLGELFGVAWAMTGPVLITFALNALGWIPFVHRLDAAPAGKRTAVIIGVGGVFSLISAALVFVLLLSGFFVVTVISDAAESGIVV